MDRETRGPVVVGDDEQPAPVGGEATGDVVGVVGDEPGELPEVGVEPGDPGVVAPGVGGEHGGARVGEPLWAGVDRGLRGVGHLDGRPLADEQYLRAQGRDPGPGHEDPSSVGAHGHAADHAAAVVEDRLLARRHHPQDEIEVDAVAAVGRVDDASTLEHLDETVDEPRVVHERSETVLAHRLGDRVRAQQRELGALVAVAVVGDDDGAFPRQVAPVTGSRQRGERARRLARGELDELDRPRRVVPDQEAPRVVDVEGPPRPGLEETGQEIVGRSVAHGVPPCPSDPGGARRPRVEGCNQVSSPMFPI